MLRYRRSPRKPLASDNHQSMSIARIENFHLSQRPMFSAIYGSGIDDIFIDADLRRFNLFQALYRQFKAEGYTTVFYSTDTNYNLFSLLQE